MDQSDEDIFLIEDPSSQMTVAGVKLEKNQSGQILFL